MEKYIPSFGPISAVIEEMIGICMAERIAEKNPATGYVLSEPRPERVFVNFVYPDHV